MTFEAASAAVAAFQFSLPVICLDACTIKCPNMRAVLLTATFQTTEGHLLTMCFGTASGESIESWGFKSSETNAHQLNIGQSFFMSDRHKGD